MTKSVKADPPLDLYARLKRESRETGFRPDGITIKALTVRCRRRAGPDPDPDGN